MKAVNQFTLGSRPVWGMMREYRRHLLKADNSVCVVYGDRLHHQFQCDAGYLLVTSYDYFEGTHHWFYLSDLNGHVLDRVSTPDYFGFIEKVQIEEVSSIGFGFFGTNDRWSLTVRKSRSRFALASSVVRRFSGVIVGGRSLALRCTKGAPWSLPDAQQAVATDRPKAGSG